MAEVGLLLFARIALQVCWAVLPRYRSGFSKHQFNQPQLLAILCLMRYEDWTFREAEVRLGEHRELRQVLGLLSMPDLNRTLRTFRIFEKDPLGRASEKCGPFIGFSHHSENLGYFHERAMAALRPAK